jgi:phage N-6-adenine-methyltransferase
MKPSKLTDNWATPQDIFEWCCKVFNKAPNVVHATWRDLAATAENSKCATYYTKESPAVHYLLECTQVFCNPPYSDSRPFIEMCNQAQEAIMLLKCDPSTQNFKYCVENAQEIVLMNFRVKFIGAPSAAPFPTMAVYFNRSMPKRGARIISVGKKEHS